MKLAFLLLVATSQPTAQEGRQQAAPNQRPADPTNPTIIKPTPEREVRPTEQPNARQHKPEWWGPETAPDWLQVILTIAAGWIAWSAFNTERNTVRLTQRADVLMESMSFNPRPNPFYLTDTTKITVAFRNYGPTRASEVFLDGRIEVNGVKHGSDEAALVAGVMAANHEQLFSCGQLGTFLDAEAIRKASKGDLPLFMETTVRYKDIFGVQHTTFNRGRYYDGTFVIEIHDAD